MFAVFLFSLTLAQTAPKFSYQAVVRNASNELVTNDSVSVRIQFYNHAVSGGAVYSELHRVTSNRNGLVSLLVGEGENPVGNLSQVTWNDAVVRTEITLRGGYTVSDTKPVAAVPLACFAEQIPLQALEEHLGSTNLVSADALRDTLAHYVTTAALTDTLANYVTQSELPGYVTATGLSDTLSNYVTESELSDYVTLAGLSDSLSHYHATDPGLLDTLANYVTVAGLSGLLANYVTAADYGEALGDMLAALADLRSITTAMEEFIVPASPTNSFQLGAKPLSGRAAILYINGVCVSSSAFSVVNRQLTYLPSYNGGKELVEGDRIQFYYHHK